MTTGTHQALDPAAVAARLAGALAHVVPQVLDRLPADAVGDNHPVGDFAGDLHTSRAGYIQVQGHIRGFATAPDMEPPAVIVDLVTGAQAFDRRGVLAELRNAGRLEAHLSQAGPRLTSPGTEAEESPASGYLLDRRDLARGHSRQPRVRIIDERADQRPRGVLGDQAPAMNTIHFGHRRRRPRRCGAGP